MCLPQAVTLQTDQVKTNVDCMHQELVLSLMCYAFLDLSERELGWNWASLHDTVILNTGGKLKQGISVKMTFIHFDLVSGNYAHLMWVMGAEQQSGGRCWVSW